MKILPIAIASVKMEGTNNLEKYASVSPTIKIRDYFDDYTKFLAGNVYNKQVDIENMVGELEKISYLMGVSLDECKEFDQLCRFVTSYSWLIITVYSRLINIKFYYIYW